MKNISIPTWAQNRIHAARLKRDLHRLVQAIIIFYQTLSLGLPLEIDESVHRLSGHYHINQLHQIAP